MFHKQQEPRCSKWSDVHTHMMKVTDAFHSHCKHAPKTEHTHKYQEMYTYICTHGRHRLQAKCCGLGKLRPQKRKERKGRVITIKWTNRDEKAMQEKEEKQIKHRTQEEGQLEIKI